MMVSKVDEMRAVLDKVMEICKKSEAVKEERQLRQLLKQVCSLTAKYMID